METTIEKKHRNIYALEFIDSIFYSFWKYIFLYYFGVQKNLNLWITTENKF
jgi:hypothetical protein